ncbi:MAG: hydrogenase expression/formation C-terminal domain-containing protein [Chromatiales bacterium]|jgi:hydrogenase-1 operon protein HyaF
MDIKDIPVRVTGPGSQPGEQDGQTLEYIDMPSDMAKYVPPQTPEPEAVEHLEGAREAMSWLRRALADYRPGADPLIANLSALDDESRDLVNQILGEGEVSVTYNGAVRAKTQESVLAGVWRTLYLDADDNVSVDLMEVADVPHVVRLLDGRERPIDASAGGAPEDVPNALPILVELASRREDLRRDGEPHSINLSLLPLSEAELEFLDHRLGRGPVDLLSRAYGRCQVISTLTPNIWWVRYYNSMGTPILNSLEVVDVPQVVPAAPEDLRDSAVRLEEILAPYWADGI